MIKKIPSYYGQHPEIYHNLISADVNICVDERMEHQRGYLVIKFISTKLHLKTQEPTYTYNHTPYRKRERRKPSANKDYRGQFP